jgi:hypothetical protein
MKKARRAIKTVRDIASLIAAIGGDVYAALRGRYHLPPDSGRGK